MHFTVSRLHPFVTAAVLSLLLVTGCHPSGPASSADEKSYPIQGRIVATDTASGHVTLDHGAIPGFMEAMTMAYKLKDSTIISELHPGDRISARLLAPANGPLLLDQIVITAQGRPDYKPTVRYHVPSPGDQVPDFALLNQSGKIIHIAQFRGKVLLATFIYTRCQLAEFCPRMSRNFADIDHALAADPALYSATHLLSISFDPAYDTPAVLRSYGGAYTGRFTKETFNHWDFASPPIRELPTLEQYFDLGVTPGDNKTLNHSLATILIGKDGKVVAFYPTNDWSPQDLLTQIKQAKDHSANR